MMSLSYQMGHIQYQIFKIILSLVLKKHTENVNNSLIRIYVNKIKSRVTFKIKNSYYFELLTLETTRNFLEALKVK